MISGAIAASLARKSAAALRKIAPRSTGEVRRQLAKALALMAATSDRSSIVADGRGTVFVSGWGVMDDLDSPYPSNLQGGSTPVAECSPGYGESESILCAGTSVGDPYYDVTADGTDNYLFNSSSLSDVADPAITLGRGIAYEFFMDTDGEPLVFQTTPAPYNAASVYDTGVNNGGVDNGTITFTVPETAPDTLYYVSQNSPTMTGTITITDEGVDACYGDSGGPLTYGGKLVGVVSMGPSCPPAGIGVYANVDYFSSWIMCHAQVANPFGGPHFCGDEAGFVTVADTLRVSKGTWGGQSATYKWLANGVAIPRQTQSTLALTGLLDKNISVEIRSAVSRTQTITERYDFAKDEQEIQEPVGRGIRIDLYPSGDFVPCIAINPVSPYTQQPQKGSCTATKGQSNGELQTSPGFSAGKYRDENGLWRDESFFSNAFWAYRDVNLPPKTVVWTWGVIGAFSRGTDEGIGAEYYGYTAPSTWNKNLYPDQMSEWQGYSRFEVSRYSPYKYTSEAFDGYCYSGISGPMGLTPGIWGSYETLGELTTEAPTGEAGEAYQVGDVIYVWDTETTSWLEAVPYQEPAGLCQLQFSDQILKGNKGRLVMGSYGSEFLGSRFSFDLGVVVSEHE